MDKFCSSVRSRSQIWKVAYIKRLIISNSDFSTITRLISIESQPKKVVVVVVVVIYCSCCFPCFSLVVVDPET